MLNNIDERDTQIIDELQTIQRIYHTNGMQDRDLFELFDKDNQYRDWVLSLLERALANSATTLDVENDIAKRENTSHYDVRLVLENANR